jgi:hypothetical protein
MSPTEQSIQSEKEQAVYDELWRLCQIGFYDDQTRINAALLHSNLLDVFGDYERFIEKHSVLREQEPGEFRNYFTTTLAAALSFEHPRFDLLLSKAYAFFSVRKAVSDTDLENLRGKIDHYIATLPADIIKPELLDDDAKLAHNHEHYSYLLSRYHTREIEHHFDNASLDLGARFLAVIELLKARDSEEDQQLIEAYKRRMVYLHTPLHDPVRIAMCGLTPSYDDCKDRLKALFYICVFDYSHDDEEKHRKLEDFRVFAAATPDMTDEEIHTIFANNIFHTEVDCNWELMDQSYGFEALNALVEYLKSRNVPVEKVIRDRIANDPNAQRTLDPIDRTVLSTILEQIKSGSAFSLKTNLDVWVGVILMYLDEQAVVEWDMDSSCLEKLYLITGKTLYRDHIKDPAYLENPLLMDLGI